jgi:hypothetical protein
MSKIPAQLLAVTEATAIVEPLLAEFDGSGIDVPAAIMFDSLDTSMVDV